MLGGGVQSDEVDHRKGVIASHAEQGRLIDANNLLNQKNCLCLFPPVTEYMETLDDYQRDLRKTVQFFSELNGMDYEEKKLMISIHTVALSETDAVIWSDVWQQRISGGEKRY